MTESIFFIVIFALFGIQTIASGTSWVFNQWRTWQDIRDWWEQEEEEDSGPK